MVGLKKYIKFALILTLFLFLFVLISGCDKNKMTFYENTKSINLSDENIKSITINSDLSEVKKVFGKPKKIETINSPSSKYYIFDDNKEKGELEFKIIKNKVERYLISDNEFKTSNGIAIGDSKENVIKAYGKNYYERTDTGSNIIGYFDKKNKLNLEFAMDKNNKINGMLLEIVKK